MMIKRWYWRCDQVTHEKDLRPRRETNKPRAVVTVEVRLSYTVWLAIHPGLPRFTNLPHAQITSKVSLDVRPPSSKPHGSAGTLRSPAAALLYDQEHHLAGYRMPYIKGAAPSWSYSIPAAE